MHQEKRLVEELDSSLKRISKKENQHIHVILSRHFNCLDIDWDNNSVHPGASDRQVKQLLVEVAE